MIILNRSLSWVVALCRISSSVVGLISGVPTSAAPRLVLQISDLHLRRYQEYIRTRVCNTTGTAEFQVTWPPKLREGTYLVKNVRARFEYRKTIAAHEKQVIMQEKTQPCASLWRKTLRPKRVRFLAIDAPIVDYVCLPFYHLTFLGSYQPLCEFSWRKKKEKARKKGSGFIDKILTWVSGLPRSATTPIHHFVQYAKVTLLEISPCQGPHSEEIRRCILLFLCTLDDILYILTVGAQGSKKSSKCCKWCAAHADFLHAGASSTKICIKSVVFLALLFR